MARRLIVVVLAMTVVVMSAAPAHAWTHPVNSWVFYYMPGPPPGSYLTACVVGTSLSKDPTGDIAFLVADNNFYSSCGGLPAAVATIVVYNPSTGQLQNGLQDSCTVSPDICVSPGPTGMPVFGARFTARNIYGYISQWGVTVL